MFHDPLLVKYILPKGVVTCTYNPTTLGAKFRNSVVSILVGGEQSCDRWVDCVTTCNLALGEEPD